MTTVEMHRVTSSQIAAIGHNGASLIFEFLNGGKYKYADVPESELKALLFAPSVGKYFSTQIKPKFKFEKLG